MQQHIETIKKQVEKLKNDISQYEIQKSKAKTDFEKSYLQCFIDSDKRSVKNLTELLEIFNIFV